MELPDQLHRHEVDDDIKGHVGDSEAVVHGLEIDASSLDGVVPCQIDRLTLEQRDEKDYAEPQQAEAADNVDGVAERARAEYPAVEQKN